MSELPNKRIDGEIDEITTQSFQNYYVSYNMLANIYQVSTALMPTTMIEHTMK